MQVRPFLTKYFLDSYRKAGKTNNTRTVWEKLIFSLQFLYKGWAKAILVWSQTKPARKICTYCSFRVNFS
jgi:hypothetical protein